jgi:hypothetical protein
MRYRALIMFHRAMVVFHMFDEEKMLKHCEELNKYVGWATLPQK